MIPEDDNPREACGVFGVYSPGDDVARLTFYGLYALQHRGQESAGIATSNGESFNVRTGMGLVAQVFDEEDLAYLRGHIAIGHTRYSTAGGSLACNAQPLVVTDRQSGQPIALAHNGNLTNADTLRDDLIEEGVVIECVQPRPTDSARQRVMRGGASPTCSARRRSRQARSSEVTRSKRRRCSTQLSSTMYST